MGENSAFEYGGSDEKLKGVEITRDWIRKYGVTNDTEATDWVSQDISLSDLWPYMVPEAAFDVNGGIKAFSWVNFKWDPIEVYEQAKKVVASSLPI